MLTKSELSEFVLDGTPALWRELVGAAIELHDLNAELTRQISRESKAVVKANGKIAVLESKLTSSEFCDCGTNHDYCANSCDAVVCTECYGIIESGGL